MKRIVLSHVNNFRQESDEMLSRITDGKVFISFNKTIFPGDYKSRFFKINPI
jgi:hypothetical protein